MKRQQTLWVPTVQVGAHLIARGKLYEVIRFDGPSQEVVARDSQGWRASFEPEGFEGMTPERRPATYTIEQRARIVAPPEACLLMNTYGEIRYKPAGEQSDPDRLVVQNLKVLPPHLRNNTYPLVRLAYEDWRVIAEVLGPDQQPYGLLWQLRFCPNGLGCGQTCKKCGGVGFIRQQAGNAKPIERKELDVRREVSAYPPLVQWDTLTPEPITETIEPQDLEQPANTNSRYLQSDDVFVVRRQISDRSRS